MSKLLSSGILMSTSQCCAQLAPRFLLKQTPTMLCERNHLDRAIGGLQGGRGRVVMSHRVSLAFIFLLRENYRVPPGWTDCGEMLPAPVAALGSRHHRRSKVCGRVHGVDALKRTEPDSTTKPKPTEQAISSKQQLIPAVSAKQT